MRTLHVTPVYYPELNFGGPPQKIHDLCRGLVARGHHVNVVTLHSEKKSATDALILDAIRVQYLPWVGRGSFRIHGGLGELWRAVAEAEIVHCYGLYTMFSPFASLFAHRLGRPFVLEPLGMYVPRLRNVAAKKLYHGIFTNPMAHHAAAVIAASKAEAQDLEALVDKDRLILRRNGIAIERFRNLPDRRVFRQRLSLPDDTMLVLYVGRISPIKNLEMLIHAFKSAAIENTALVLVGPMNEPDYAKRLQTLVMESGWDSRVIFAGPLYDNEKLAALASADLLVLPSISESYGNSAAEAVAAGVPVLLTEGCGIAPTIHRRAGLAVSPTISDLAYGMRTLLLDSEQRQALTQHVALVRGELSWDEPIIQTEDLYAKLLGTGK